MNNNINRNIEHDIITRLKEFIIKLFMSTCTFEIMQQSYKVIKNKETKLQS